MVVAPCDDTSGGRAAGSGSGVAMLSDFSFWRFDEEVLLQVRDLSSRTVGDLRYTLPYGG